MTDPEPTFSVDITEDELFKLLGNDTRMRILGVLWEEFDFQAYVTQSQEPVPFSDLRSQAGRGNTNFNYHLEQLLGVLVEKRDVGYLLTPLGYNLMRAIDTYATFEYDTVSQTPLEEPCPFCDGTLLGRYEREILEVRCRDCGALAEDGNFTFVQLETTTAGNLELDRLLDVGIRNLEERVESSFHGICWECHSTLERTLERCDDHERDGSGVCPACSHRYGIQVDVECPNCNTGGRGPLLEYALLVPDVRALFRRHGLGPADVGPWCYRLAAFEAVEEADLSVDPPGVTYRFALDDDVVAVRIEEADEIGITVDTRAR